MKITSTLLALVLAAAGTVAACGGSQPEAESAPPAPAPTPAPAPAPSEAAPAPAASEAPPAATAPPEAPAAKAWPDLSGDERKELMKTVVLPTMKTAFQEFDAKRFAEVRCTTCHGAGAMQGKFTMPNPALPKLDPKDGFAKHMKKDPKTTKFMMEHVAPDMGKILGIPPFDPKTNQGFGCFNCHTMAGK